MAKQGKTDHNAYSAFAPDARVTDYEAVFGWTDNDWALLERLQDFIPDKVFDAHAHLSDPDRFYPKGFNMMNTYGLADVERFQKEQKEVYGDRKVRAMFLPLPSTIFNDNLELRREMNAWMNAELYKAPDCVGAIYVMPQDTVEDIEAMLTNPQIRGFKCYHMSAITDGPSWLADVEQYLPESAWQVADKRGMSITIHMVKAKALSDEKNMAYYKKMTAKYPNAKLILAHCARGFASWTTIEAVRELKGIPNIYYDMAAITDAAVMAEVIRQAGPDHVMWGTDYCIDRTHATYVNVGESFCWLYRYELPEDMKFPVCKLVLESLLAFKMASLLLDLTREEIEQIFYRTGCGLYGLEE